MQDEFEPGATRRYPTPMHAPPRCSLTMVNRCAIRTAVSQLDALACLLRSAFAFCLVWFRANTTGQYGYYSAPAQGMALGTMTASAGGNGAAKTFDFPEDITFVNNIVYSCVRNPNNVSLISLSGGGGGNGHISVPFRLANYSRGLIADRNIYYNPCVSLEDPSVRPFPCTRNCSIPGHPNWWKDAGSWHDWQQLGPGRGSVAEYDVHSMVADPLFNDAENGDFSLKERSPAINIGFVPLPAGVDQC